jgi:hypothetical protein
VSLCRPNADLEQEGIEDIQGDRRHPHSGMEDIHILVPRRRECAKHDRTSLVFRIVRFEMVRGGPVWIPGAIDAIPNSLGHRVPGVLGQSGRATGRRLNAFPVQGIPRRYFPSPPLSSEECNRCRSLAVEPAAARLLGQDLQRLATTHRSFEPATKLPNRLDPAVVFQM